MVAVCERKDKEIAHLKEEADKLTDYAVEIRYPEDSYEIHENDAREAFEIVKEVKAYIFSKVSL